MNPFDICERLGAWPDASPALQLLLDDAADEIEQLRILLDHAEGEVGFYGVDY